MPVDKLWKIRGLPVEKPVHLRCKLQGRAVEVPGMFWWTTLWRSVALRDDKL